MIEHQKPAPQASAQQRNEPMTSPIYAAHDDGFIYGLGPTPEEAEAEYRAGVGDDQIASSWESITISEVTPALAAQVEAEGGAITWGINHRFELCTEDEAADYAE